VANSKEFATVLLYFAMVAKGSIQEIKAIPKL
jgi:hypothetical protein